MATLERLGLVMMIYGIAMRMHDTLFALLFATLLLFTGGLLLLTGRTIEKVLKHHLPKVPW